MDDEQIKTFLQKNRSSRPITYLANVLGLKTYEVTSLMRKLKIQEEVSYPDHVFIANNLKTREFTKSQVMDLLCLSNSQYQQIVNKKHANRSSGNRHTVDREMAITSTKKLIEVDLKIEISPEIAKQPLSKIIQKHNNPVYQWATHESKNDETFKYFGPVAYILCACYPNRLKPFFFRGSKGQGGKSLNKTDYFSQKHGKKLFLDACFWILATELELAESELFDKENHEMIEASFIGNSHPLRKHNLYFYGLNHRLMCLHFTDQKELVGEVLRSIGVLNPSDNRVHTKQLRNKLDEAGIPYDHCGVPYCDHLSDIEIHHIVPVKKSHLYPSFDINSVQNLIALCPNHHKEFKSLELTPHDLVNNRSEMIDKLIQTKLNMKRS